MHFSQGNNTFALSSLQSSASAQVNRQQDIAKDNSVLQSSEKLHQTYIQLCQERGQQIDKILIFQNMKIREKNWVEIELDREIGIEMFRIICEVIRMNKFYVSLRAKNFDLGQNHFQVIESLIKDKLIELSMNNCNLSTNMLSILSSLIKSKQCKMQKLKIINNNIGYDGACILQDCLSHHKYLKYIYIEYCSIDNQTISQIMNAAETIQNLQFISLEGNKLEYIGLQIILETMKRNTNIKQLYIRNNPIGDESINLFKQEFFTFSDIDFSNCMLTFIGINDLTKTIMISEEFKNCCNSLNLSNNILASKGAKQIFQLISIQFQKIDNLNLSNTKLGDQVIDSLSLALKSRNCQLKSLDLSNNYITDNGAIKIFESIKQSPNSQLQRVNLIGNYISEQCENYLIQNNTQLGSSFKFKLGQQMSVTNLSNLHFLENYYQEFENINKKINTLWKNYLDKSKRLNVNYSRTLRAITQQITCCKQKEPLRNMIVNQTNIGINEIEIIQLIARYVPSIENLTITNCDLINYVQLQNSHQNQEGVHNSQQSIQYRNNESDYDQSLIIVKIGEIISDNNNINNLQLTSLNLTTNQIKDLLEYLKYTNKPIRIDFSKNLIDDNGFLLMLEFQKNFHKIFQHIVLSDNKLSYQVFPILIQHLKQAQNVGLIEEVSLDSVNDIQANNIGEFFYDLSLFQPKLVNLSLCKQRINDSVAETISYFIKNSQYIESLNLSFNELTDVGANVIINGAWANQFRFQKLSMLGNFFSKKFFNYVQNQQQQNNYKVQILIEPSLTSSNQQQNQENILQDLEIRMAQLNSSLGAANQEDPQMPIVEQSLKDHEISYQADQVQQDIVEQPIVSGNHAAISQSKETQSGHFPVQSINSKKFINSQENIQSQHSQHQSQNQLSQQKIRDSQPNIPSFLQNSDKLSNRQTQENINFDENFKKQEFRQSNTELQKSYKKDDMTFGINSQQKSEKNNIPSFENQQQYQQQINFKQNATSTTSLENQNKNQASVYIDEYIKEIHQIEGHIKDLFERQTFLVEEIKQKISLEPQIRKTRQQESVNQLSKEQISQRSHLSQIQNSANDLNEHVKKSKIKNDQNFNKLINLPSEQYLNIENHFSPQINQIGEKKRTQNTLSQLGTNNDFNQMQLNSKNDLNKNQYSVSNNHLPRNFPISSALLENTDRQQSINSQKVVHSLNALKERIQDLEEQVERESIRQMQHPNYQQDERGYQTQQQQLVQEILENNKPQNEQLKVRINSNLHSIYQKNAPSSVAIGSTLNEINATHNQLLAPKSMYTATSIPTENNLEFQSVGQNLNKYSNKYNPAIRQSKVSSNIQTFTSNLVNDEDNRKNSFLSAIQGETRIPQPNESTMKQINGLQNQKKIDPQNVKEPHQRDNSQQKNRNQSIPPQSMILMEDNIMNLNASPQRQQRNNEIRMNQDKEIQDFLNIQHQNIINHQQNRSQVDNEPEQSETFTFYQSGSHQINYNMYQPHQNEYQSSMQQSRMNNSNESPHKILSKQKLQISQISNVSGLSQMQTSSQSSPSKSRMKGSIVGNKNIGFSKRVDNVQYLVEELVKLIERYEYLIQMCSELKQIKQKIIENLGGDYNYNQINNNNLQKICGVETDLRDKMKTQERQIYESINELREIGLQIDDSKLKNWDNLKAVLISASEEYQKNQQLEKQQFADYIDYRNQDFIVDSTVQNQQYQQYNQNYDFKSNQKNRLQNSQTYQLHS
ncbi:endo-1,4-beta-xylanase xylA, putative (macronuclear) [Tetrahymena thermophila SB210]|uniref:Endo-1,4-beta-xylanase xylA, putative n=1 Tax=Tetrahymena thermophila (strain SB210) TaxID=312017 RepID=Q22AC0_TETTS|nr:endo-1,4-beta-xylanase xylA, putative [Tetrahymena thermophila SB210]EAR82229.2 endo-1,4-beta-xylanase xylA, putative [Tetrahymena thermophila SB210]|eukprot:XP_001029892.2 endo-1,4-beta-xylanase xylA, putative [Tetrahymena thermophila SB210]